MCELCKSAIRGNKCKKNTRKKKAWYTILNAGYTNF